MARVRRTANLGLGPDDSEPRLGLMTRTARLGHPTSGPGWVTRIARLGFDHADIHVTRIGWLCDSDLCDSNKTARMTGSGGSHLRDGLVGGDVEAPLLP